MYCCMYVCIHSLIYSLILFIERLFKSTTRPNQRRSRQSTDLHRSFTPKRHKKLRVKDLPKVPAWRLERDSNPRPFGRKATNLPMSHDISTTAFALLLAFCMYVSMSLSEYVDWIPVVVVAFIGHDLGAFVVSRR